MILLTPLITLLPPLNCTISVPGRRLRKTWPVYRSFVLSKLRFHSAQSSSFQSCIARWRCPGSWILGTQSGYGWFTVGAEAAFALALTCALFVAGFAVIMP